MNQFTSEQARRWDAWQAASAVTARHSDRVAHLFFGVTFVAAVLNVLAATIWR